MKAGKLGYDPELKARAKTETGLPFGSDKITVKQEVKRKTDEPGHLENVFK